MPVFRSRATLSASPADVFAWHERPGALERLTPPWEDVRVLERSGGIRDGAEVRLKMKRGPLDFTWHIRHRAYEEGRQFVDEQVKGPFQRWVHTHRFLPADGGGCVMEDEIEWEPPLGSAGELVTARMIERDLRRAFAFRHRRLADDLELQGRFASQPRLTVAITGASGLVGTTLGHLLTTGGHRVVPVTRDRAAAEAGGGIYWNPSTGDIDEQGLVGVDAVVHLAGEPIQAMRWTSDKKRAIRESRVQGTELISRTVASLRGGPSTLISASGVHFYGGRGDEILTETSPPGRGFLAETCKLWEGATRRAEGAGIRVVRLRCGLILSTAGGALPVMLWAFKAGLAGRIGSGRQYVSWIDLDDAVGLYYHALMDPSMKGTFNATAPHPVTNATFTDVLGRILHRPTVIPVPKLGVRALLGEMGDELLLQGQRVRPAAALAAGYGFFYEGLEDSLRHQLGRPAPDSPD